MKEIESEEQHRVWFYRQLESITNKLETLPLSDTVSSSLYLSPCAMHVFHSMTCRWTFLRTQTVSSLTLSLCLGY